MCLAGMILFISCSHYSDEFIEKYLHYGWDEGGSAIIVYPQDEGFCFFENDVIRQILYPQYGANYLDYQSFLRDLLNGKVGVKRDAQTKITRFDKVSRKKKQALINEYLSYDESVKVYEFKKRLNKADELGIVKMMFDMGYYVHWNDYAAEFVFVYPKNQKKD
jgi:hypothetical protein